MNIRELYPSKYVSACDLQGRDVTLTIRQMTVEEMRDHGNNVIKKPVLWFEKATKGLVLNKTNAMAIAQLHSDETDNWPSKRITLYPTQVKAFGRMEEAIRIRPHVPAQPAAQNGNMPVEEPAAIDDEEDYVDDAYLDATFD